MISRNERQERQRREAHKACHCLPCQRLAYQGALLYSCDMGILHFSDGQRGIIHVVWHDVVTWQDWLNQIRKLKSDPVWHSSNRFIEDLRSVIDTSTIGLAEVDEAVKAFSVDNNSIMHKRGAVIALEEFAKARRFADLSARLGMSVVIFNSLDTACLFLGLDLVETRRVLEGLRSQLRGE